MQSRQMPSQMPSTNSISKQFGFVYPPYPQSCAVGGFRESDKACLRKLKEASGDFLLHEVFLLSIGIWHFNMYLALEMLN